MKRVAPGLRHNLAFTLTEMLIAISILTMMVLFTTRLFNSAADVTTQSTKRIDADSESRAILDRIAIDLAAMIRRADIDYFVKTPINTQPGNDQIAFFSQVPGYYPSAGSESPISLVAYRISTTRLERLAKGLLWNAESTSGPPLVFLPLTIEATWPAATNSSADPQSDYETFGAQVFRFEYCYHLADGSLSATPWAGSNTSVRGFRDVVALEVAIALIDRQSKVLASDSQLTALRDDLRDFDASAMRSGDLAADWQDAINSTTRVPKRAAAGVRVAYRSFPLIPH